MYGLVQDCSISSVLAINAITSRDELRVWPSGPASIINYKIKIDKSNIYNFSMPDFDFYTES